MKLSLKISHLLNYQDFFAALIIYIITFPRFEPDYTIGLDSSYFWALNFLFANDYSTLTEIIYPYGPLTLFKDGTVTGNNFEYFILFYSIVKIWFTYLFISINSENYKNKIIPYFLVTFLLLLFTIEFILIGICFIYSYLFTASRKNSHFILSVVIAFIGICIKSSIGVSCFSIVFIAQLIFYFDNKTIKKSIINVGLTLLIIFILGIIIFRSITLTIEYLINTFKLSISYSSALSIFPDNNWILLSVFILSVFYPLFFCKNQRTKKIYVLLIIPLFAMWKHAISRQDYTHSMVLFNFLFLFWGFLIVFSETDIKKLLLVASISISSFYANIKNTWDFKPKTIELNGVLNFNEAVLNFNAFKTKYIQTSLNNIAANKLPDSIMNLIGNSTIDSYPFELSYFAANAKLKWKMRRTLQSGSFARWLDKYNSEDFDRINGPEFLIFHYIQDKWNGNFGSIDDRYLLNDNPLTIYNLFSYYSLVLKTDKFLLLKRNIKDNLKLIDISDTKISKWNEWIDISTEKNTISRMKLISGQNLIGKLISFLYKSEAYYVDYMMEDGKIFTYRFIPENAKDGIWIDPLIRNPQNEYIEESVTKIRFRCSYEFFNKNSISYQIEKSVYLNLDKTENFQSYFNKSENINSLIISEYKNNFETDDTINSDSVSFTGKKSNKVNKNGSFSYTYSISLDSLWNNIDSSVNIIQVVTDIKYFNKCSDGKFVISCSASKNDFWKANTLNHTHSSWDNSMHIVNIYRNSHNNGHLKIYVWNTGDNELFVDDFRIKLLSITNL